MMRITGRAKKIALFVTLGAILVGLAVGLNATWVALNWREAVPLSLGRIFFRPVLAGGTASLRSPVTREAADERKSPGPADGRFQFDRKCHQIFGRQKGDRGRCSDSRYRHRVAAGSRSRHRNPLFRAETHF